MNNMCVLDNWVGYDYKSIALPAELQGHFVSCVFFIAKTQLNQFKKNKVVVFYCCNFSYCRHGHVD